MRVRGIITLITISMAALLIISTGSIVTAAVLTVGPGCGAFPDVRSAVNNAMPGDVIQLCTDVSETFNRLPINMTLTIDGNGYRWSVTDSDPSTEAIDIYPNQPNQVVKVVFIDIDIDIFENDYSTPDFWKAIDVDDSELLLVGVNLTMVMSEDMNWNIFGIFATNSSVVIRSSNITGTWMGMGSFNGITLESRSSNFTVVDSVITHKIDGVGFRTLMTIPKPVSTYINNSIILSDRAGVTSQVHPMAPTIPFVNLTIEDSVISADNQWGFIATHTKVLTSFIKVDNLTVYHLGPQAVGAFVVVVGDDNTYVDSDVVIRDLSIDTSGDVGLSLLSHGGGMDVTGDGITILDSTLTFKQSLEGGILIGNVRGSQNHPQPSYGNYTLRNINVSGAWDVGVAVTLYDVLTGRTGNITVFKIDDVDIDGANISMLVGEHPWAVGIPPSTVNGVIRGSVEDVELWNMDIGLYSGVVPNSQVDIELNVSRMFFNSEPSTAGVILNSTGPSIGFDVSLDDIWFSPLRYTFTTPYQSTPSLVVDSPSGISIEIGYSVLNTIIVYPGSTGSMNIVETVYNEAYSVFNPGFMVASTWTIQFYLQSSVTSFPLGSAMVEVYVSNTLLASGVTAPNGVVNIPLTYILSTGPVITQMSIEYTKNFVSKTVPYIMYSPMLTYPSWFAYINETLPVLYMKAQLMGRMGTVILELEGYRGNASVISLLPGSQVYRVYQIRINSYVGYGEVLYITGSIYMDGVWVRITVYVDKSTGSVYAFLAWNRFYGYLLYP